MSPVLVELGLAVLGVVPIAALYQLCERGAAFRDPQRGWGLLGGVLAQLLGGLLLFGVARGIAVVVGGWMAFGGPFVACLNASRVRTLAAARWVGVLGGVCLLVGLLMRASRAAP